MAILDVVAVGINEAAAERYSETVSQTNGVFLRIEKPEDVRLVVSQYIEVLDKQVPAAVVVTGQDKKHTMFPGAPITLTPGSYTVALPDLPGLDTAHRRIPNVTVKPGETKVLNVAISDSKPVVQE